MALHSAPKARHYAHYKPGKHLRAGVVVAAAAVTGLILLQASQAATFATGSEAESGTIAGNATKADEPAGASGGRTVRFGGGSIASPTNLKTFTGGKSIALRWTGSTPNSAIKQYNIFRNGVQVGTVKPEFNFLFPEKDFNGYLDTAVTTGSTYQYQVQAVSSSNTTSPLSAAVSATHPTSNWPEPTITYDTSKASDLEPLIRDKVIPFLKVWYPKVVMSQAYPNFSPQNTFKLHVDPSYTGYADARVDVIRFNPTILRDSANERGLYGTFLHESSHIIQWKGDHNGGAQNGFAEGTSDYAREFLVHDRDSTKPYLFSHYVENGSLASYFINHILENYDSGFLKRLSAAYYNQTVDSTTFYYNGNTLDQIWNGLVGLPPGGPIKSAANSNMCIDVENSNISAGTKIQTYSCNGSLAQKLVPRNYADGTIDLRVLNNCLHLPNDSTRIILAGCRSHGPVKWRVQPNGTLIDPVTGRCLQVQGGSSGISNGKALEIGSCSDASWQKWNLPVTMAIPRQVRFKSDSSKCLDVPNGNAAVGVRIQVWDCNGNASQGFIVARTGSNGQVNLGVLGQCAIKSFDSTTPTTDAVLLSGCNTNPDQLWQPQSDGSLKNDQSGRCLDTASGSIANSQRLITRTCSGAASQLFTLP